MNQCLAVYDVTGIQDFIFASSKAKENIGGSIYIQKIFENGLTDCIKSLGKEVQTNWKQIPDNAPWVNNYYKAEVIYIGGGNAMILFINKTTAVKVTKELSQKILKETQATLGIVVAYQETDLANFKEDKENLFKKLNNNKNSLIRSTPLRGISITRECVDGLPTSGKKSNDNIYISDIAYAKRDLAQNNNRASNIFSNLLPENSNVLFPDEFDDLGQMEGESHIAVVHIDGNSMGQFIDEKIAEKTAYTEAIPIMGEISIKIQSLYTDLFKKMVAMCNKAITDEEVKKQIRLKNDNLPVRPIILNGDDVAFVCDGRIGIQLAAYFLGELANTPLNIEDKDEILSACAGVAIVKSHFPFFRAYQLAEELCASAKEKAKYLNQTDPGCWLDYHIVYSGFQTDLDVMRSGMYDVPGMDKVSHDVEFPQYNLLIRPFCVSGNANTNELHKWENMKTLRSEMVKIPRSRLKGLRNSFIISEENAKLQQEQNSSRNYHLPEYNIGGGSKYTSENLFQANQTPYFEPLELLDFYLPSFEKYLDATVKAGE